MRMALWNVFQIQQLKDVGFRSSQWNCTCCGLWGRAWCASEVIKAQLFQKDDYTWHALPLQGFFFPTCDGRGAHGLPTLTFCSVLQELSQCVQRWLSSMPCSKGLEKGPLCCVPPALPQPLPGFASALVSQYWLASTELLGQLLWLPLWMETPVPGSTFPALMKCAAACSTCKPYVDIAKQHPSVICHNYCCQLHTIEMLEHQASSSTASNVFLQ